jgi:hypothetical protein
LADQTRPDRFGRPTGRPNRSAGIDRSPQPSARPLPASNPRTRQAHTRREELVAQALADPDIADRSRATDERRTHPASIPKCAPRWRCPARLVAGASRAAVDWFINSLVHNS